MATSSQSAPTANLAHLKLIERKPQESYAFGEFAPDGLPAEEKQKLVELEPKQTYWMQQGKTTPAHQLMPQYFNGTFLRGAVRLPPHGPARAPAPHTADRRRRRRRLSKRHCRSTGCAWAVAASSAAAGGAAAAGWLLSEAG